MINSSNRAGKERAVRQRVRPSWCDPSSVSQELEPILILEGLAQLTGTLPRYNEVRSMLDHKRTNVVVTDAQFHHLRLGSLVSGACDDATARAFHLPKRLNGLWTLRRVTGQVALLAFALIAQ